jgi:hypothetical protein
MTTYEPHELALVFPPMSEPEFAAFKEDIRAQGQQEPIILYEGKILDGRHRYRACVELGREPRVVRFEGNPRAAAQFVLGRNFHRRHLTASQRALVAAEMCKLRPRGNAGTSPYLTAAQASALMGVGQDLVKDAKHLLRTAGEEVLRAVRDGKQSVSAAVRTARVSPKDSGSFTFLERFAQRLDRALQGRSERDAQVVYGAKPMLQYITLRIQDYLDPRPAEPLSDTEGAVVWDPAELKVPDWLHAEGGEAIAVERRSKLAAVLPRARQAAASYTGARCAGCGLPLLPGLHAGETSYCAVCKGDVLWEWSWMRDQVEMAFGSALGSRRSAERAGMADSHPRPSAV